MRFEDATIEWVPVNELVPYDNNAKRHTRQQIDAIEASIREFGFRAPVVAWHDEDGRPVVVAGHARTTAARNLGMGKVPVVFCDDLDDAQRRALTLVDNQTTMMTGWDEDMLAYELDTLAETFDMRSMGFCDSVDFSNLSAMAEDTDESRAFEEKFKPKKTTDDCYTPPEVYEVVRDWACAEYGIDPAKVVRPFYPGGDYERFDYSNGRVVIDNPPFSILSRICEFYLDRGVKFFLFAPSLTCLSGRDILMRMCHIPSDAHIEYENGAVVRTGFVTSYDEGVVARTAPSLTAAVNAKVDELHRREHVELPKYEYPDNVLTAAIMGRWDKYGIEFEVRRDDCTHISCLDAQKEDGKGIYGGGSAALREGRCREGRCREGRCREGRCREGQEAHVEAERPRDGHRKAPGQVVSGRVPGATPSVANKGIGCPTGAAPGIRP